MYALERQTADLFKMKTYNQVLCGYAVYCILCRLYGYEENSRLLIATVQRIDDDAVK